MFSLKELLTQAKVKIFSFSDEYDNIAQDPATGNVYLYVNEPILSINGYYISVCEDGKAYRVPKFIIELEDIATDYHTPMAISDFLSI